MVRCIVVLIQRGSSKMGPWKLRYTAITKTGHEQIRLRTPTGFRSKGVHRLVALAYIPNPNSYPIVRHLDLSDSETPWIKDFLLYYIN